MGVGEFVVVVVVLVVVFWLGRRSLRWQWRRELVFAEQRGRDALYVELRDRLAWAPVTGGDAGG
jgi:hypothetical protein